MIPGGGRSSITQPCARIGAIHFVVFGGFAAASLAARIRATQTAEAHRHRRRRQAASGKGGVTYKALVDESIRLAKHPPGQVLHFLAQARLTPMRLPLPGAIDLECQMRGTHEVSKGRRSPGSSRIEPSYILYTSRHRPAGPKACSATCGRISPSGARASI